MSLPEALQTSDELSLLVNIYVNTGRAAEAVKLLSSKSLGLSSRFASEDPGLILRLLVESFQKAQAWSEAVDFCETRLVSKEISDPVLWELVLIAVRESQHEKESVQNPSLSL